MRRPPDSFAAAVRAFKELTASTGEGDVTRARVLDAAHRSSRGHATPRRISLPTLAGLLVICTASIAGTTAAQRWRRPAAVAIDETPPRRGHEECRAMVVIPSAAPAQRTDLPASAPSDAEAAAYGRAHRAHFQGGSPARALAAWEQYLRLYPRGAFVPEARFNRALCLVRLGRATDAERALRPFSEGRFGGYRRAEADRLLAWLYERRTAP